MSDIKDMAIVLGGILLPKYGKLKEIIDENSTDRITLGGNRFTDYRNNLRSWEISWDKLEADDYDSVRGIYDNQFDTGAYPALQIDAYAIYAPVRVEITDRDIKYNGSIIEGFSITLREQYAIS